MPRVPTYQLQSETRPTPTPYRQPNMAGQANEAIVQGFEQVSASALRVAKIVDHERELAEATRATMAVQDFARDASGLLYDSRTGYMNNRGESALDTASVREKLQQAMAKYGQGFSGKAQQVYRQHATAHLDSYGQLVERHAGGERGKLIGTAADGAAKIAFQNIAVNHTDDKFCETQTALAEGPLLVHLSNMGLPAEVVAATMADFRSQVAELRMQGYVNSGDSAGAQAFFTRERETLGAKGLKFERQVADLVRMDRVETVASNIMLEAKRPGYEWIDPMAVSKKLEAFTGDAETKKQLDRMLDERVKENEDLREKAGKAKILEAISLYEKTHKLETREMNTIRDWLLDVPNQASVLWMKFERGIRAEWREGRASAAEARREQAYADTLAIRDFDTLAVEDPDAAMAVEVNARWGLPLEPDKPAATPSARLVIRKKQQALKDRIANGGAGSLSETKLRAMEAIPGAGEEEQKALAAYMVGWHMRYLEDPAHHDREPTRKEVNEAIGQAIVSGETKGWAWDPDKFRYQVEPGEEFMPGTIEEQVAPLAKEFLQRQQAKPPAKAIRSVNDIPEADRAELAKDWKDTAGSEPSNADLVAAYRRHMAKQGAR